MRELPADLIERERERARRLRPNSGAEPKSGDLWSVASVVTAPSGEVLEHSQTPLIVCVLEVADQVCDVAPIGFDPVFAGTGDVVYSDVQLLGQPFVIEIWLHMAVLRTALAGRVVELPSSFMKLVRREIAGASIDGPNISPEDPRFAFRQAEHMRFLFATAGSADEFEERGLSETDPAALAVKRHAAKWLIAAATDGAEIPFAYEGSSGRFERRVPPRELSETPGAR